MNRLASIAVRQTLVSTAIVLCAVLAFAALAIGATTASMRADLLRTIDTDIAGLVDVMAGSGVADLEMRIGDRIALAPTTGVPALYLLAAKNGARLAGNLAALPPLDAARSATGEVMTPDGPALLRATRLRGGLTLVVGRSLAPSDALVDHIERVFAVAAAATLAAALMVGLIAAGRLGTRVARLNDAFDRFDRGDLGARAGATDGVDEVALLGRHVDVHLERIEHLFRAQRQISDDIAHELRTPLVHLDTRLLEALDRNVDPAVARSLDRARDDVRSVVSLFDALLDIAMAEAMVGGVVPGARFDLSEVAGTLADLYAPSAEEAGIDFVWRIAPSVDMRGEAMQITRLIANLLDNAFKYAPAGSRVVLTVAAGPRLVVEDNGPGIAAADREAVFERFRRSTAVGNGHGLGLALVRVIAVRHGLTARVEDAAPGARFVVAAA
jgi:signal transduction histidine kinase